MGVSLRVKRTFTVGVIAAEFGDPHGGEVLGAARLALKHLKDLGHKRIAFLRGQQQSSDSATRWEALEGVAKELHICVLPELVMQIEGLDSTPDLGYPYGKELIKRNGPFTAMVAYNDISAIGAMNSGLKV